MAPGMFVERSVRRIRFARLAFLLAGLAPCAAVVAWALHLRSDSHREAVRAAWQQAVGVPVAVEAVEHPRPGVVRGLDCRLTAPDGGRLLLPAVEVETAPAEVRLRIDRIAGDEPAARLIGGLVAEWLGREARYPRDCVVEIDGCGWAAGPRGESGGGLRAECVSRGGSRAVRIVRTGGTPGPADEFRAVRTAAVEATDERLEFDLSCVEPLPVALVAAAIGRGDPGLGTAACVSGTLHGVRAGMLASGTFTGRITGIDLAACTRGMQARAEGEATVVVRRLAWSRGRIEDAEVECDMGRGRVEQRLLDGLVATVGCRPGPAYRTLTQSPDRRIDAAGCLLRIDARGVEIVSGASLGGPLAVADGLSLVDPPAGVLPPERLAWLLAPVDAVFVPSAGPGAWLLELMPRADQAVRPRRSGGF